MHIKFLFQCFLLILLSITLISAKASFKKELKSKKNIISILFNKEFSKNTAVNKMFPRPKNVHNSSLTTQDPYHLPGYDGFCPQFKYQIGQTFGRTTARLLNDSHVASSGNLVLAHKDPEIAKPLADRKRNIEIIKNRTKSFGDQKYVKDIIPGYTGFVPKFQHFYGKTYADTCNYAIADFETDQKIHDRQLCLLNRSEKSQSRPGTCPRDMTPCMQRNTYMTPLVPVAKDAKPYVSKTVTSCYPISPYDMENWDPNKKFMSGYTGFVPRSRGLLGAGYPIITNNALIDFTNTSRKTKRILDEPVVIHRKVAEPVCTFPIYPKETGMVPHYTGHVPGQKFTDGKTFGNNSKDALVKMRHQVCEVV